MAEPVMCRQDDCPEIATVNVFGPHGDVAYCEDHAQWYEKIMATLGAETRRRNLADHTADEAPRRRSSRPDGSRRLPPGQRTARVQLQGAFSGELGMFTAKLAKKYDLSAAEVMLVLASLMQTWAAGQVRDEWGGE